MNTDLLIKNLTINSIFYIVLFICIFLIAGSNNHNFYTSFMSFVFITFFGYILHVFSHVIDFRNLLNIKHNFIQNKYFKYSYNNFVKLIEFHSIEHHNSKDNKSCINIAKEACNNLFFQGVGLYLFVVFIKNLDTSIFLIWAILYTSIHLINYNLFPCEEHINHHKDPNTNYGIEIYDILFNTKNKTDILVENYNHYSINLIIITIFYLIIKNISI
tara:strand:+ start:313 stop:960 length:648 start_codon:yes stop_codon:yes gene_type:complete